MVGDTWLISVTNASNGIPVEVRWTTPQGGQIVYIVGYTVSGSFQSSTTVLAQNVGIWTAEWRVGGQIVSSNLTEIINLPTSVLKGPTFPGSEDCAADSDQPYGFIGIDMSYKLSQRVDEIPMFLIGQVATFGQYESEFGNGPSPVADDPSGGGGFGACGTAPFTNFTFQTRLWIRIGGVTGNMVRLNDWVQTSNAAHSGNLKNNNDFSITR